MAEEGVSMREILFRAKRLDTGEWVEGFFSSETFYGYTPNDDRVFIIQKGTGFYCPVDPATVGQFTGLVDKNGRRIFEGDVVRHHNDNPDSEIEEKGVVFWDEKYCGWRRTSNGQFHHGIVDTYRLSPECLYEVIGNIHDNPELLEGGQA